MAEQKLPKLLTTAETLPPTSKTRRLTGVSFQTLGIREQNEKGPAGRQSDEASKRAMERPMPDYPLPEHLQAVRNSLSDADLRLLAQEVLDKITPLVYAEGLRDGREKLLQAQQESRERRRVAKGPRQWLTVVYFIRSPTAVKIGMSNNAERRLGVLQTSHSEPLHLAATCAGGRALERDYHRRFSAHRLHGEWFSPHPDILAEIERLTSDAP